jgi:predicted esterase
MAIWQEVIQQVVQKCKMTSKPIPHEFHGLTIRRAVQIEAAYKACPNTKLVASGYSQGGQIVHNAIGLLPAAVASWSMFDHIFIILVSSVSASFDFQILLM